MATCDKANEEKNFDLWMFFVMNVSAQLFQLSLYWEKNSIFFVLTLTCPKQSSSMEKLSSQVSSAMLPQHHFSKVA